MEDINSMKEEFSTLLRSTGREGVDNLIEKLGKIGFFTAPASSTKHLCVEGGLLKHSLNVCRMAMMLREQLLLVKPELEDKVKEENVIIASLLHDVCKSDIYKSARKWRKDDRGQWEQYDTYEIDYSDMPLGHGEKSVIMLQKYIDLRLSEMLAIRWHMGAWNLPFQDYENRSCISMASEKTPLVSLLQAADNLAAHVLEVG